MKPITVIIADDEELAVQGLEHLLDQDPEVTVVATCGDGESVIAGVREQRPDLLFLDIHMPRMDGLEALRQLRPEERPVTIFVTAYDQYAVRAFEVAAVDYLLKPFSDSRLREALTRAKATVRRHEVGSLAARVEDLLQVAKELSGQATSTPAVAAGGAEGAADRLVLKTGSDLVLVKAKDIVWLEAEGDFVKVHQTGQQQLVRETLRNLESRLPAPSFCRIHRSVVVNIEHVQKVTPALYGDYHVFMSDGSKLRMSRSFRKDVKHRLPSMPG